MTLRTGIRLGPYEITAPLGAGGMGEVYRATDAKLKRDVAIKVLPEDVANDRERLARFEREAHVLASLNHPHIASIYGLEESDAGPWLVLELVEGQTLAERLEEGALPMDRALELARQIASALEAAHEKGIIHRDLKPANAKITHEGIVKVLDFGLAKAFVDESVGLSGDASQSPTLTAAATRAGVILGTAAYMSPEQARGKRVDKRTDIWAFGCVLYEMLTGRQAFPGETASDAIARILEHEPDWQALPARLPLKIRDLIQRSLRKDHRDRLHDIADARIEIEEVLADPSGAITAASVSPVRETHWRRSLPWMLAATLIVALTVVTWVHLTSTSGDASPATHLSVLLPPSLQLQTNWHALALSPDGRRLAMVVDHGGVNQIFLRELGETEVRPLAGTDGGNSPFFSPDGNWVGFRHEGEEKLMKVSIDGGAPILIVDDVWGRGSTWGPDDLVIFTKRYSSGLWRVPAAGGTPEVLTEPDANEGESGHHWPQLLPGGREILFTSTRSRPELTRLMVYSLETGQRRTLVEGAYFGRYVPTGHLLYLKNEILFAIRFDLERLATTGTALPVLDNIGGLLQYMGHLNVSENGTLAYIPHSTQYPPRNLIWVDRGGSEEKIDIEPRSFANPTLSPDGRRIVASIMENDTDVWVYELSRGTSIRLTHQPTSEEKPIWTRDGRRVIYNRESVGLYWRTADGQGQEQLLHSSDHDLFPWDVSPDGKWLLFSEEYPDVGANIWMLPLDGKGEATPFLRTPFIERAPSFSPDGRWVAYDSNESGQYEVYIQEFPGPGDRHLVSMEGGTEPRWSRDGQELYFLSGHKMMAVAVRSGVDFQIGKPHALFEGPYERYWVETNYDVAPDGRFLMVKTPRERAPRQVNVVLNWFEDLERLVPTK